MRISAILCTSRRSKDESEKTRGIVFVCIILIISSFTVSASAEKWNFIITGDSRGFNNGVHTDILAEIVQETIDQNAEFILFPGDLVNGSSTQSVLESQLNTWIDTMQPLYDAGIGVYPVRGNHETGPLAAWHNVFSGSYALPSNGPAGEVNLTYSVAHKNVFFVGLDQYVNLHRVNQTWLNNQFAANTNPHIFVFGHEPAFAVQHSDCLDDYPTDRNTFWFSLRDAGCKVYACGHDHFYDHAAVDDGDANQANNVHQYIVGTAGAPLRYWSPPYTGNNGSMNVTQVQHVAQYGYVLVEVLDDTSYKMSWYERNDFTGEYSNVIIQPDLDSNSIANYLDLDLLLNEWLEKDCNSANNYCNGADFDWSQAVDMFDYDILANLWMETVPQQIVIKVTTSSDDAEQAQNGNVNYTSSDIELTEDGDPQTVGLRFINVSIPQGSTITKAYIQFTCDETGGGSPCSVSLRGQDSDNASTFTTTNFSISNRPTTSASVSWNIDSWNYLARRWDRQRTPNIASLIQEIVDRPGWQSGNSLAIIIRDADGGTGKRVADSQDGGSSNTRNPELLIEFE